MKYKYIIKSKFEFNKWLDVTNLFVKSLCSRAVILHQFNDLTSLQRNKIKKAFSVCDDVRRKKISKGETDEAWLTGIMVDANIIAYEYDIDPLTVTLCINPICKSHERILVK